MHIYLIVMEKCAGPIRGEVGKTLSLKFRLTKSLTFRNVKHLNLETFVRQWAVIKSI